MAKIDSPTSSPIVPDLQAIANRAGDLPAFPSTAMAAMQMADDEELSAKQLNLAPPILKKISEEVRTMIPTLSGNARSQEAQRTEGR